MTLTPTHKTIDRIANAASDRPNRRYRTIEALSLAGTLVALWITFFLWDLAVVEHNVVSGWLIETVGWYATAGLALTSIGLVFTTLRLAHSWYPSRWWLAVAGGVSLVHVGNAVNDLYVLWVYGIPESFLVERLATFVFSTTVFALVVAGRYELVTISGLIRNRSSHLMARDTARALAFTALIVLSLPAMSVGSVGTPESINTTESTDQMTTSSVSLSEPVLTDIFTLPEDFSVREQRSYVDDKTNLLWVTNFYKDFDIETYDVETGEVTTFLAGDEYDVGGNPYLLAVTDDHIFVSESDEGGSEFLTFDRSGNEVASGTIPTVSDTGYPGVESIVSGTGNVVYVGEDVGHSSQSERVWEIDTATGDVETLHDLHSDDVMSMAYEDGLLVTGSRDESIVVYDVENDMEVDSWNVGNFVRSVAIDTESGIVGVAQRNNVMVRNYETGTVIRDSNEDTPLESGPARMQILGDFIFVDGVGSDVSEIGVYDLHTGEPLFVETEYASDTTLLASINGKLYDFEYDDESDLESYEWTVHAENVISGTVHNTDGEPIEGATVSAGGEETTTDEDGVYMHVFGEGTGGQDAVIEANTTVDSDAKLAPIPRENVNFTLADGDIGGQVLACDATDIHCSDPSPLPNATVEIMGLDHLEIENYFDDVDSPEEAKAKAEELLEEARTWDIDDWESGLDVFDDVVDEEPNANYAMMHTPEDWGIQGDSSLTDRIVAGERPDLENPIVQMQPGEEVILSVWDPTKESSSWREWFFSDFASEEAVGGPVEGTVEISQLGPGGESMGTAGVPVETDIQYVDVSERVGIITGTVEVPVRSHRFSEGYYRVSVDGSPAEYIIQVGDPDVEELFPSYFTDIEDEAGELTEIAEELNDLQTAGVLEVKTVQANEEGRWSADLPDTTETVGVTAWKGPQDLLDPDGDAVQAQLMELQREAFNILETDGIDAIDNPSIEDIRDIMASDEYSISDVVDELDDNALDGTVFDESIYAPREPVETDVPSQIDIKTTRIGATSLIDPLHYDAIFESQLEDFIEEWLEELLNEWDFPLEKIEDLEELDELLEELLEDQENLIKEIEELEELIEELENADGELTEEELEELLEELELDVELEGVEELAELIEELGDLFDSEDDEPEELLEKIAALEAMIEELRERVNDGDGEISNGEYFGEFHFPGEIDEDSVSARVYFQSHPQYGDRGGDIGIMPIPGQHFAMVPDEYITVSSSVNPFDDGQTVVIDGFPIPDDQAVADVRVDANVDGNPVRNEDSTTNPAFDGDIPGLQSIDLSSLRPAPDDSVRISLNADEARYDRIVDIVAYDPEGNEATTDLDRLNDQAFVTMNGTGGHWVELTYQSTSGHNFTHSFQIGARDQAGTPGPTIQFDRSVEGLIGMAGEGVEAVDVDKRPGHPTRFEVVSRDSDISDLHVRTLDQFDSTDFSLEVVTGDDRVAVTRHVTVYFHHSVDEDALLWRDDSAVPKDGNVLGEYLNDDGVILTYTDDTGQVDVSIVRDPGILDRASHWINLQRQSLPLLSLIPPLVLLVPVVLRRRWFA